MRLLFAFLLVFGVAGDVQAQMSGGATFPGPGVKDYTAGACANDGPDGVVDLSRCSNAFYLATGILG
jgi:hypothetical protein